MLETPYFVCDAGKLRENCEIVAELRKQAGAKVLFAIKSFTMCGIFRYMAPHFDGVVASSLYEARLARDHFRSGPDDHREVHTYSPGFRDVDIDEVIRVSDAVVFNSQTQQSQFAARVRAANRGVGLRLNPDLSARADLASGLNFCSPHSRIAATGTSVFSSSSRLAMSAPSAPPSRTRAPTFTRSPEGNSMNGSRHRVP